MTQFVYESNKDVFDTTSALVLERDEDGNVTKEVSIGESVSLTKEEVEGKLAAYNFVKAAEVSDEEKARLAAETDTTDSLTFDVDPNVAVEAPVIDEDVNKLAGSASSASSTPATSTSSTKSKN